MIKAVIFDFDGTLSNRKANAYYLFKDYFRPFFKDFNEDEYEAVLQDMVTYDCNGTIRVSYRLIPFIHKYGKYFSEEDGKIFDKWYYDHMGEYAVLKPETLDVLNELKGKYKLGLITNGISSTQHSKIKQTKIEDYFDEIIVSGDLDDIAKPDKRIFEIMADKLGLKPEECVYVGDVFASDVIGAIRANMVPIWLMTDKERPSSYKGLRILDINELPELLKTLN